MCGNFGASRNEYGYRPVYHPGGFNPIGCLHGQAVTAQLGKEAFQAVDIAEIVKPVTKKSYCVREANQLPTITRQAFHIAREGRPGPVLIDLPLDVQKHEINYDPGIDSTLEILKPAPCNSKIKKALEMPRKNR
jgi:tartronate-semialdehyde synthase